MTALLKVGPMEVAEQVLSGSYENMQLSARGELRDLSPRMTSAPVGPVARRRALGTAFL